jgi:hypothetical protein
MFEVERDRIQNFTRATVLRAIAEAQVAMGDPVSALSTYRRAVTEGAVNPNARPRAEDLAATCCSMAVQGVQPDEGLGQEIARILAGLDHPW